MPETDPQEAEQGTVPTKEGSLELAGKSSQHICRTELDFSTQPPTPPLNVDHSDVGEAGKTLCSLLSLVETKGTIGEAGAISQ